MTAIVIGVGLPLGMLLIMFIFRLFAARTIGWVLLCMAWGALGYEAAILLNTRLGNLGIDNKILSILLTPLLLQILIALGVLFVVSRRQSDNLVDGAVYGFAAGLGFAILDNVEFALGNADQALANALLRSFSSTLVLATASGIVGVSMTQFHFRHRANRVAILLSGLGAAVGYNSLYNLLAQRAIGGEILPVAFGIGGITLVGLYLAGQLRTILNQLGIEKKRADSLLDIVIPIGVQLSTEKNFGNLLENMLVEAKKFCSADAGTLYLAREKHLEFAVLRNDTLRIAMGGSSPVDITLPDLHLYDDAGTPNHHNIATYAALTGKTINIEDAYETKDFDFSGTRAFDRTNGYQSISFLTIPLKGNEGKVLGVLQLINALNSKREIIPFDKNLQLLMESFSSLATAALEGYIQEQKLRNEIQQLRIEIDAVKRSQQVEEITNSDYFKNLQEKAKSFRDQPEKKTDD
ncbi:MAG: PrsW family intramembrane metalloprotease [Chloroflexi bacterium]|nr:PrsW family intramembrane metalloprotease [Chloroflexota bacterium]